MYAKLMNENVRIRAENVMLRKVVFALIAQADKNPFMSIGYFAEHGRASSALAEIRALNDEQERQPDVTQLVEALEYALDTLEQAEINMFHNAIEFGREALAAYRKGGA